MPTCDHDFLCLQKRGFKSLYKIRITDADLHVHYNTLEGFMDSFAENTAAVSNGVAISVHIEDLDELPQAELKVLPHLKSYGNKEPGPNAIAGLRSGGVPQVNTLTLMLACDHD